MSNLFCLIISHDSCGDVSSLTLKVISKLCTGHSSRWKPQSQMRVLSLYLIAGWQIVSQSIRCLLPVAVGTSPALCSTGQLFWTKAIITSMSSVPSNANFEIETLANILRGRTGAGRTGRGDNIVDPPPPKGRWAAMRVRHPTLPTVVLRPPMRQVDRFHPLLLPLALDIG